MATRSVKAGFGRIPSRTSVGSRAYWRASAGKSASQAMQDIINKYNQVVQTFEGATPGVLLDALQPVFDKSQEYVPRKTGLLASTGNIEASGAVGGGAEASITYGGPEAFYAVIVHEATWLNHAPPTRSKYLQAAMEAELNTFLDAIAESYGYILS